MLKNSEKNKEKGDFSFFRSEIAKLNQINFLFLLKR